MKTLQQAMPNVIWILIVSCLLGMSTTELFCPERYNCEHQEHTFVLTCQAKLGDKSNASHFKLLNSTIQKVDVTHLKIRCTEFRQQVSLLFENLSNIQRLTLEIRNLTSCGKNIFQGITNISSLIISSLSCKAFHGNAFNGLINLRSLTIEKVFELEFMHPGMLTPLTSLQSLTFRYIGNKTRKLKIKDYGKILRGINSTSFRSLVLYAIYSHTQHELNLSDLFQPGSVGGLLKVLDIGGNNIVEIVGSPATTLPVIEDLSLSHNLCALSRGCRKLSQFWIDILKHPRLKTLSATGIGSHESTDSYENIILNGDQNCSQSINISLGPQLRSISFSESNLILNSFKNLCVIDLNGSLEKVDLSNSHCTSQIKIYVASFSALKNINLRNINLSHLATDTFSNMPNLTILQLGQNNIGNTISKTPQIFYNNNKLLELDLAACQLTHIPHDEFIRLRQLQKLDVSWNELQDFHVCLDTMKNLSILNLSHNKLSTLSSNTRKGLDKMTAVKVDISENPLLCTCNNVEFVTWVQSTTVKFRNKKKTFCRDDDNSTRTLFTFNREVHCPTTGLYLTVLLPVTLLICIVCSILPCVAYRYHWQCDYCCRRIHVYKPSSANELNPIVYERDAFICYNSSDRAWVCDVLLKRLEDNNVSTIIHQRDFLPGSIIEESIRESIDKCHYCVLVLSPDFLASNYCLLEMHLASRHGHKQCRDVIVPIILREIPKMALSRTLVKILEKSYLKWTNNQNENELFWDKLVTKLKCGVNIKPL